MTQALAIHQSLSRSGHDLVGVLSGRNSNRTLPEFFERGFPVPVTSVRSPGFVFRDGRAVDLGATLWQSLASLGEYRRSLRQLRSLVEQTRPDLVINFFEPLTGLQQLLRPLPVPVLSIAHQFMISHPAYPRARGRVLEQWGLRMFVRLVGARSLKLALSLTPEADFPERDLTISPPLLREDLFRLEPCPGDYVLVYILNHAYAEEITRWHRANPAVELHCFYDRPGAPDAEEVEPNLTFHRLSGAKFLTLMAGCRVVVCTAGFESVGEAAWLGKPVLVVPVENHAEQRLNALEVVGAGFGIADGFFNLDRLRELPPRLDNSRFRAWVEQADRILERAVAAATAGPRRKHPDHGLPRPRVEVRGAG